MNSDPKSGAALLNFTFFSSFAVQLQFYFYAFWFGLSANVLVPSLFARLFGQRKAK